MKGTNGSVLEGVLKLFFVSQPFQNIFNFCDPRILQATTYL
jgi:hypothetical protein